MYFQRVVDSWLHREDGQDIAEYAILLVLIAVAAIVGARQLGQSLAGLFRAMADIVGNLL